MEKGAQVSLGPIPQKVKWRLFEMTNGLCEWCGTTAVDCDHYPRRSQPGSKNDTNHLIALCRKHHEWSGGIRNMADEVQYQEFLKWKKQLPLHELDKIRE